MNNQSKAKVIAETIKWCGGRTFYVGGYVRDSLIGQVKSKDIDLEVYGIQPEKLNEILRSIPGELSVVGASFKVFKLSWWDKDERCEIDISIPREDKKVGEGHKGFEVVGNPFASFEDACRRRDFTINAILKDVLTGEIIDPFNGKADIENKLIRAVDAAHFGEDSLRVIRAAQFAGRFGFDIEEQTKTLCQNTELNDLAKERIWEEIRKMFLKSPDVRKGLDALYGLGIVDKLFKPLKDKILPSNPFNNINSFSDYLSDEEKLICHLALFNMFVSPDMREELIESLGSISEGKHIIEEALKIAKHIDTPDSYIRNGASDYEFRKLAFVVNPQLLAFVLEAVPAPALALEFRTRMDEVDSLYGPIPPLLQGRHLIAKGLTPGPEFGKILDEAYDLQLKGIINNFEQAQEWLNER